VRRFGSDPFCRGVESDIYASRLCARARSGPLLRDGVRGMDAAGLSPLAPLESAAAELSRDNLTP